MRLGCECDVSRSVLECRQSSKQILRAVVIKLFLDIETLPGEESLRSDIAAEIKPRSRITKAETLKKWEEEQKPARVEEEYRRTALEGLQGRILCIGYLREDGHGETEGVISGDERDILTAF